MKTGLLLALLLLTLPASAQNSPEALVSATLDSLHARAARGDFDRYFDLYAKDAIFMGTDATERWTIDEFKQYAGNSSGWTYHLLERHITMGPHGMSAWFDERLDNANLGETRGTGVLVLENGSWKFAHYNLTIPVPNEIARDLANRIRALKADN